MHGQLAVLAASFDWNYALRQSPARIVAIAAFVATTLQYLKRYIPLLSGWWAIAANVSFSASLIVASTMPDQLFTPQTFGNVLIAAMGAAGIHGTGKLMFGDTTAASPNPSQSNLMAKAPVILLMAALGVASVGLGGCNSWERQTYQTLAATQATINQAQDDYEAGTLPRNELSFEAVNKAKEAQKLAVQAFAAYEQLKQTKGSQTALDAQQQIVSQALGLLPSLIVDIKALYTPAPATPIAKPVGYQLRLQTAA